MSHMLLKRYPSLYDLVYLSSYLYETEGFYKCKYNSAIPPWSVMSRAYISAQDSDFIWRQGLSPATPKTADRLLITTCFSAGLNDPLLLLCIRNRKPMSKSPWYAERFIPRSEFIRNGQFAGIPEGEWLRKWAIIRLGETHDYFGALAELQKMTLNDERWYFGKKEDKRYPILGNYLRYVFYKLWMDQYICYSADKQMAAFNTGLVNNKYEYIYAVFDRMSPINGKVWNLKGFCIAGEQGLGKEFLRQFSPVPRPARFFTRTAELIYEINYELPLSAQLPFIDYNHILHDNLSRFPLPFLHSICFGYDKIQKLLTQISLESSKTSGALLDELWEKIDGLMDDELYLRMKGLIERAVQMAMRRVMWNYKTAIPVYFPTRNTISWLLPLALTAGSKADVALVVERFPNGNLEGHTVLDLDMAYTDARLVSKPESDWLSPDIIQMGIETRQVIEKSKKQEQLPLHFQRTAPAAYTEDIPVKPVVPAPKESLAPAESSLAERKSHSQESVSKNLFKAKKPKRLSPQTDHLKKSAVGKTLKKGAQPATRPKETRSALEILHSQAGKDIKITEELIGRHITLSSVSAIKNRRGLQGIYQGVVVTIPQKALSQNMSFYTGKPMNVVITGTNTQKTQYTAAPVHGNASSFKQEKTT